MKKKELLLILIALTVNTPVFALVGAEYVTLDVKGVRYDVPIPNNKTRDDFYFIKKALAGDTLSREMVLGGKDKKYFYIGDVGINRWLILTPDGEEVVENKI